MILYNKRKQYFSSVDLHIKYTSKFGYDCLLKLYLKYTFLIQICVSLIIIFDDKSKNNTFNEIF